MHLWSQARCGGAVTPDELDVLSDAERSRAASLLDAGRRQRYVAGRVLCRTALSLYAPVDPAAWALAVDGRGRPHIDGPATAPPMCFSLSHTATETVCAVASGPAVGVDIEAVGRGRAAMAVADELFAPGERRALARLAPPERAVAALQAWVLKEALAKARGGTLDDEVGGTAFEVAASHRIRASSVRGGDAAPGWSFRCFTHADALVGLAVRPVTGGPITVRAGRRPPR